MLMMITMDYTKKMILIGILIAVKLIHRIQRYVILMTVQECI